MKDLAQLGRASIVVAGAIAVPAMLGIGPAGDGVPAAIDARAVIQRMDDRNPGLRSYRARVHVNIRMFSFPFLAPKLDGTSYFKRPGLLTSSFSIECRAMRADFNESSTTSGTRERGRRTRT